MNAEAYLDEAVKRMMVNMYELTGSRKKDDVQDGINAILWLLLGHHLLYDSKDKLQLELSDTIFTGEGTWPYGVPTLGFQITEGGTLGSNIEPRCMGACRHKNVELCLVSAYAFSLWYRFDFADLDAPLVGDTAPDFSEKPSWYPLKVLMSKNRSFGTRKPISRKYEVELAKKCLESIGQSVSLNSNVRHIEAAQISRAGSWAKDVRENTCLQIYPPEFAKFTGGFDMEGSKRVRRERKPPAELEKKIFPWVEDALLEVEKHQNGLDLEDPETDGVAPKFLRMLQQFRRFIIQDLTQLVDIAPNSIFSKHPITKDPRFLEFKAECQRLGPQSIFEDMTTEYEEFFAKERYLAMFY